MVLVERNRSNCKDGGKADWAKYKTLLSNNNSNNYPTAFIFVLRQTTIVRKENEKRKITFRLRSSTTLCDRASAPTMTILTSNTFGVPSQTSYTCGSNRVLVHWSNGQDARLHACKAASTMDGGLAKIRPRKVQFDRKR